MLMWLMTDSSRTLQPSKHITVEGKRCLNMATHNYLGFAGNEEVER